MSSKIASSNSKAGTSSKNNNMVPDVDSSFSEHMESLPGESQSVPTRVMPYQPLDDPALLAGDEKAKNDNCSTNNNNNHNQQHSSTSPPSQQSFSSMVSALTFEDSWASAIPPTLTEGEELQHDMLVPPKSSTFVGAPRRRSRYSLPTNLNTAASAAAIVNSTNTLLRHSNHRFEAGSDITPSNHQRFNQQQATMGGPPRRRPSNGSTTPSRRSSTGSSTAPSDANTSAHHSFGGSSTSISISTIETDLLDEDLSFLTSPGEDVDTSTATGGRRVNRFSKRYLTPTLEEAEEGRESPTSTQKNIDRADALSNLSAQCTLSQQDDILPVRKHSPGPPMEDKEYIPNTRNYARETPPGGNRVRGRKSIDLASLWENNPAVQSSLTLESALMGEDSYFLQMEPEDLSPVGPFIEPKRSWGVTSSLTLSSTFFDDSASICQHHQQQQPMRTKSTEKKRTSLSDSVNWHLPPSSGPAPDGTIATAPMMSSLNSLRFSSHGSNESPKTYYVGKEQKTVPTHFRNDNFVYPCSQPVRRTSEGSSISSSLQSFVSSNQTEQATRPGMVPLPPHDLPSSTSASSSQKSPKLPQRKQSVVSTAKAAVSTHAPSDRINKNEMS